MDENGSYKIGTKFRAIDTSYSQNQFSICNESGISVEDVSVEDISLRGCARKFSFLLLIVINVVLIHSSAKPFT